MRVASILSLTASVFAWAHPVASLRAQTGRMFAFDRELPLQLPEPDGGGWPSWNGHALASVAINHKDRVLVSTVDSQGTREEIWFGIPDASQINVYQNALGPDGTMALAGSAFSSDAKGASWLGLISPDRKRQSVIRVWSYVVHAIAIAADGAVWTAGVPERDWTGPQEIRRFDSSGRMLSSWIVHAKSLKRYGWLASEQSYLVTSHDRVGWVANAGEYYEYALDGHLLGKYAAPDAANGVEHEIGGAILSPANDLLVNVCGTDAAHSEPCRLAELERGSRTWRTVEDSPGGNGADHLVAFDGEHPLFYSARGHGRQLRQYSRATAQGAPTEVRAIQ